MRLHLNIVRLVFYHFREYLVSLYVRVLRLPKQSDGQLPQEFQESHA